MYKKAFRILAAGTGVFLILVISLVIWVYRNQEFIIGKAKSAVESSINGRLDIGGFEFKPFSRYPGLTFSLTDIRMTDSLYAAHEKPFIRIGRLDVTFSLETLFLLNVAVRDIDIRDGSVFVFVRRDSYSNLSIFPGGGDSSKTGSGISSGLFRKIKSLKLSNVRLTYADSLKDKYYGLTMKNVTGDYLASGAGWEGHLNGPLYVEKLIFNPEKGAFLKNSNPRLSASLRFDGRKKQLEILPETRLELEGHERIAIGGTISTATRNGPMKLHFSTDRIRVPVATRILADTIASQIDRIGIDTYVSADVTLQGELGEKRPWVEVGFRTDTFSYATPVGYFRGMKTGGNFSNRADTLLRPGNTNSRIKSGLITGFFEKVPVKGYLKLKDLSAPEARITLLAKADSSALNSLLDTQRYLATGGTVSLALRYSGKLKDLYNRENDQINAVLAGRADISDLAISYLPRNIRLSRIESSISLNQQEILIHKLNLYDNQNQLYIKGKLSRFLHHLLGSSRPARAILDIDIPKWKLNWIEVLVGQEGQRKKASPKKFSRLVDQLADELEVEANLKAGQLRYYNFVAQNVAGKLDMSNNVTRIHSLGLDAFGGRVTLSGDLKSPGSQRNLAVLTAAGRIRHANISDILHSFSNFGQKALSSQNVKGQLDLDFRFSSEVRQDVSLIPHSMDGSLDLHFTNGRLINFEPFLKIKKVIFKNRPLENVKIAPIRKRFTLKGQEVRIQKMQIESNILTLFLEGQYSFGDKTDLSIQFPLKNFRKRDEEYQFQTYDSEGLRSIFLRAVEENGEVNIRLDSRKKARKRTYPDSSGISKDSTFHKQ